MEFLGMYLGTIITSLGLDIAVALNLVKEAADHGYKIDIEQLEKNINEEEIEFGYSKSTRLIPVINMLDSMKLVKDYFLNKEDIIYQYKILGYLKPLTKE